MGSWSFAQVPGGIDWEARFREMEDRYLSRIAGLESRLSTVEGELSEEKSRGQDAQLSQEVERLTREGMARPTVTTRFTNAFNPSISVLGDFVLAWSDRQDSRDTLNRFILREVELGISGRVDPYLAYYVFVHLDEGEIELEEAYAIVTSGLPDTFTLKAGRYNADFGRLSPVHDAELPFVDKPAVLQDYLDGSLRGTGAQLHHWLPLGEDHLFRWSVGVINGADGDAHPIVGLGGEGHHHDEGSELDAIGKRGVDDFALTARATALFETGEHSTLQVGASLLWAPHERGFEAEKAEAKNGDGIHAFDLHKRTIGLDARWTTRNPTDGSGWSLGGEIFFNHQEFELEEKHADPEGFELIADESRDAFGFYVHGEVLFSESWALGASFDWLERAEDPDSTWWDAGVYLTHHINEFNRVRLEVRYYDDELGDDRFVVGMLQWTTVLGSHSHGLDW